MNIKVYCAYDEMMDIAKAVPNPRNPNTHPEKQIKLLAKVIEAQGWRAPITVSTRSGFIVRGHGRLQAALLLGCDVVPIDLQDYASEAEEWADMVADNRIAELSEIDQETLSALVAEMDGVFDTSLLGYSEKAISEMLADFERNQVREDEFDLDKTLSEIKEPVIKLGDIYQLGRHRLMCGDSTSIADVSKLMDGSKADMIFTDPPYNVDYQGGTDDKLKIKNDNMSAEDFNTFLHKTFEAMATITKPGGAIYVCHADNASSDFRIALTSAGWSLRQCLIWAKSHFVMGRQDYQWQHEPILYGWLPGAAHSFYGGRRQSTLIEDNMPLVIQEDADGSKLIKITLGLQDVIIKVPSYEVLDIANASTVIRVDKPTRNGEHPTMKPIALCAKAILNSSLPGNCIADLFGGSGSTLIAAEQTGRLCNMMELDPIYCDVIVHRYEEFTGDTAIKLTL